MPGRNAPAGPERRPLHILLVADARIPVPPSGYGGVERVIATLAEAFVARGHRVSLIAGYGSTNYGTLRTYGWGGSGSRARRALHRLQFLFWSAIEVRRRPDVVIAYARVDYLSVLQRSGVPLLYHFENPIGDNQVAMLLAAARGPLLMAALTESHKGRQRPGAWRILPNPVDTERLPFRAEPAGKYLAFLGRLTRNKGVDTAINVAQRTGMPLRIAGNVSDDPVERRFFDDEIAPRLAGDISWVGEIDDRRKAAFLGDAAALLMPIRWDEPFGIVVVEAMACGTPVLALRRGSMPELVEPGVNGFLADDEDEMVAQVARIDEIDRARCRLVAEARFSHTVVGDRVLEAVRDLIGGRT